MRTTWPERIERLRRANTVLDCQEEDEDCLVENCKGCIVVEVLDAGEGDEVIEYEEENEEEDQADAGEDNEVIEDEEENEADAH